MIEINDLEELNNAVADGKHLIEIYTEFCNPCKKMKNEILPKVEDQIDVITVNALEATDIAMNYSISSVPALLLFEDGELTNMRVGFMNETELLNFIE